MDIPQVLAILRPGEDWGPNAQTGATYAEFAATWRGVSPVPTEPEMLAAWAAIVAFTMSSGPFAVPIVKFRAGLIGLRLALLSAPEQVRAKWGVILPELDILTVVYPRENPVAALLVMAMGDGLLTAEEVLALRGGE